MLHIVIAASEQSPFLSVSYVDLFAEHTCDVVIVGPELSYHGTLIEGKQIDVVVHTSQCIHRLPQSCRTYQT